jgi:hypothetical protein
MPSRRNQDNPREKKTKNGYKSGFPATARQRIFCETYVKTWNAKNAALEAGYSETYSTSNAHRLVHELMPYIAQLQGDKEKELAPITANTVSKELTAIAIANVDDYHEVYFDEKEKKQRVRGRAWGDLTREQKMAVEDYWYDEFGNLRYTLHNKPEALVHLGKYLGMFNDKLIIERRNVDVQARFDFSGMSMVDLKQLEKLLDRGRGVTIEQRPE